MQPRWVLNNLPSWKLDYSESKLLELKFRVILVMAGAIVTLDRKSSALSRTWCCYEAAAAIRLLGQNRFHIAVPGQIFQSIRLTRITPSTY